ncbi:MAG: hypothetical protein ABIP39_11620, partial [Polyangiaceae bacterium]
GKAPTDSATGCHTAIPDSGSYACNYTYDVAIEGDPSACKDTCSERSIFRGSDVPEFVGGICT